MAAADNEILVAERGDRNRIRLPVSGVQASWLVSEAGQFSCFVRPADLHAAGIADVEELAGRWLQWQHPTAGRWGGVVMSARVSSGQVELGAQTFHALLRKRLTPKRPDPVSSTAGVAFRSLLLHAARSEPTYLVPGTIDDGLPEVVVEWWAQDIYDEAIPSLLDGGRAEWDVDADRVVRFVRRLGRDRTATVRLVDAVHLGQYDYTSDYWTISNRLVGTGADPEVLVRGKNLVQRRRRRPYPISEVSDPASIARFGPLEEVRDYFDTKERPGVEARLRADLAAAAVPSRTFSGTVADVGGVWAGFREGDTVRVELTEVGVAIDLRVMARAVDAAADAMEISGVAVRNRTVPVEIVPTAVVDYVVTNAFDPVETNAGDRVIRG